MLRAFLLLVIGFFVIGCTAVTSTRDGRTGAGVPYFLPMTRVGLKISINETEDTIAVTVDAPTYLPDTSQQYFLKNLYNPFYDENISFSVNDAGLLTNSTTTFSGKLDEIAISARRSDLSRESSLQAGATQVFNRKLDVKSLASHSLTKGGTSQLAQLNSEINSILRKSLRNVSQVDSPKLREAVRKRSKPIVHIQLSRVGPSAPIVTGPAPDCSVGLCYRMPVPYLLGVRFADGTVNEITFLVPDGSPTYAAPIKRGLFTSWATTVTLTNGVMDKYDRTNTSEIEALVALPFNLVGAAAAGLTANSGLLTNRTSQLTKELAYIDKLKEYEEAKTASLTAESKLRNQELARFVYGSASNNSDRAGQTVTSPNGQGSATPGFNGLGG